MCGIAGICRLDGQPLNEDARAHVRAMTDVITYRGPDGSGIWQEGPVSLGHRRLSIIDLSGGSQPMQDVDGELCIVFNGEIYNFAELRQELLQAGARFHSSHSDTEVILQAYRVWGTDCLQRFDGMFAFALWDAPRRRLFCARDRFGKKPFFYTLQQGSLFFGSELNCLAAVPGLELTLDPQAVMRYLAYEYVPTPDTMYREAKSLPPSHWLLVEDGLSRFMKDIVALTTATLRNRGLSPYTIRVSGKSTFERIFRATLLGDFISLHLAFFDFKDPSDVGQITRLKKLLSTRLSRSGKKRR